MAKKHEIGDVLCFCQITGWRQVWTSEAAARLHVNQSF